MFVETYWFILNYGGGTTSGGSKFHVATSQQWMGFQFGKRLSSVPKTSLTSIKSSSQKTNVPFKHLTYLELQAKKEKGLCFLCDEKYSIGYRCKNKELLVLVVSDAIDYLVKMDKTADQGCEERT